MTDSNHTRQRGHLPEYIGRKFNRWTVIEACAGYKYLCECQCGTVRKLDASDVRTGRTKSCGCLSAELSSERYTTHGQSRSLVYGIWNKMIQRCTHTSGPHADGYKNRGIDVCDQWRKSFEAFFAEVGPRPSPAHSIDRIDNDRGYEPGNVRWATMKQQSRNKRTNVRLTFQGRTACIAEWAEITGIPECTILYRIKAGKWTTELALTEPARNLTHDLTFQGETMSVTEWANRKGMSRLALSQRLKYGWSIERALTEPLRKLKPRIQKSSSDYRPGS